MFTFSQLNDNPVFTTVGYFIAVSLDRSVEKSLTATKLKDLMVVLYTVEEQATCPEQLFSVEPAFFPEKMRFIAPVTLAPRWSPFKEAKRLLLDPITSELDTERNAAFAIWRPEFLGAVNYREGAEHLRHFRFLLSLACSAAIEIQGNVLLSAARGWSYGGWKSGEYRINPESALIMHQAGYLFTNRVSA